MFHLIWVIVIGFVAGLLARFIMPGKDPGGFIFTTLLGIAGALVATFLGRLIGWYPAGASAGFIAAIAGAVIVLFLYRVIKKKQPAA
jgi:uncharacterized membrane protein YeaQ/YmgE (transglycosylase-associated protein family)